MAPAAHAPMHSSMKFGRGPGWDLLRSTLLQIPTTLGRVVYLASLCNRTSGKYEHQSLGNWFGVEEADRVLRQNHRKIFSEWLGYSLEEQKNDLSDYLQDRDAGELRPFAALIPPGVTEVERQLFVTDLETLLVLRASAGREASWNSEA
jgi:hypothetical protein